MSEITVEYNGTHAPGADRKSLWGRAAYWRISHPKLPFGSMKITTKVRTINPRPATLNKLLRAEIQRRIEAIHERMTCNHYTEMHIEYRDPYSIRPLVEIFEKKYLDIELRKAAGGQS